MKLIKRTELNKNNYNEDKDKDVLKAWDNTKA